MVYIPTPVPHFDNLDEVTSYLERELTAIARASVEQDAVDLRPIHAPPDRPREGMIIIADGTVWNPGAGKGAYEYLNGAWSKL